MKKYKVIKNQNIFDVCMTLYGTVEYLRDLLVYNPELSVDTELVPGMELEWDEDSTRNNRALEIVSGLDFVPANNERHVYYKKNNRPPVFYVKVPNEEPALIFKLSGDGSMYVDWGDNSGIEEIRLKPQVTVYKHFFDNKCMERRVSVSGNFVIREIDLSPTQGMIVPIKPITVDELKINKNNMPLYGLFLFKGTYSVSMSHRFLDDLSPINDMHLADLSLTDITYENGHCLDDYLIYIARHNNGRRNCRVILDHAPSGTYEQPPKNDLGDYIITTGMQAVYVILHEPEWNESGEWSFVIEGTEYNVPKQ